MHTNVDCRTERDIYTECRSRSVFLDKCLDDPQARINALEQLEFIELSDHLAQIESSGATLGELPVRDEESCRCTTFLVQVAREEDISSPEITMDTSNTQPLALPNLTKRKIPNLLEHIPTTFQNTREPLHRLHEIIIVHATLQVLHEAVLRHLRLDFTLRNVFRPDMELLEPPAKCTSYRPRQRRTTCVVSSYRGDEVGFEVLGGGEVFLDLRMRRGTEVVKMRCPELDREGPVLFGWLDSTRWEGL